LNGDEKSQVSKELTRFRSYPSFIDAL